jgi:hypothetical protein
LRSLLVSSSSCLSRRISVGSHPSYDAIRLADVTGQFHAYDPYGSEVGPDRSKGEEILPSLIWSPMPRNRGLGLLGVVLRKQVRRILVLAGSYPAV